MTGLLIMTALVVLAGLLASRYGVDSRDGQDWREGVGEPRPPDVPEPRAQVAVPPAPVTSRRPESVRGAA